MSIVPNRILKHEHTVIPWLIGIGLILFGLHSSWLLFKVNGTAIFYPPWLGIICILAAINWSVRAEVIKFDWRPLWVTIPIVIIAITLLARITIERTTESMAEFGFILSFIMIYLIARQYGKVILYPIVWFALIEAVSILAYVLLVGSWHTDDMTTGGLVSATNYDLAIGIMAIGLGASLFVIQTRRNLLLYGIALIVAMFLTGSPETIVVLGILATWLIIFHRRQLLNIVQANTSIIKTIAAVLIVACIAWIMVGGMSNTVGRIEHVLTNTADASSGEYPDYGEGRFPAYKRALTTIEPFGHGFDLHHYVVDGNGKPLETYNDPAKAGVIAHNVPLVIVEQIGPLAAIAWIVTSIYCFIISSKRMRIMWVIVGALCIFDHFLWTTIAPFWWLLVGLTIWEVANETCKGKLANGNIN